MENSIICTAVIVLLLRKLTDSYRSTVNMSQRETKQSNFFVYCENDNEGTYLVLSWSSVIQSLVKGKQDHL